MSTTREQCKAILHDRSKVKDFDLAFLHRLAQDYITLLDSTDEKVAAPLRCLITKNLCGTDTWQKDSPCQCEHCQCYLVQFGAAVAAETERCAAVINALEPFRSQIDTVDSSGPGFLHAVSGKRGDWNELRKVIANAEEEIAARIRRGR